MESNALQNNLHCQSRVNELHFFYQSIRFFLDFLGHYCTILKIFLAALKIKKILSLVKYFFFYKLNFLLVIKFVYEVFLFTKINIIAISDYFIYKLQQNYFLNVLFLNCMV